MSKNTLKAVEKLDYTKVMEIIVIRMNNTKLKASIPPDATSALDLSINPYYDAGYDQGQEDGYHDGIENIRGDSYDDACRYKGKKRKEYEQGYEEGYDAGFDDRDCDSEEEE